MPEKVNCYLMENSCEAARLDLKTREDVLRNQALWAGLQPGMRVADIGCGSGITTSFLAKMVGPTGCVTGVDFSGARISHARESYSCENINFVCKDITESMADLGTFDFIWVRFFLEYHRAGAQDIVSRLSRMLKPSGILCLIDLDHNCLNYSGIPERLERTLKGLLGLLETDFDFDPFVGRKLYSFLYDCGLTDLNLMLDSHHLIYGQITDSDFTNWMMKAEVSARRSGYEFSEYPGGEAEFLAEFRAALNDPRRFIYTPLIAARGRRPTP